jgi:hypothetical protein
LIDWLGHGYFMSHGILRVVAFLHRDEKAPHPLDAKNQPVDGEKRASVKSMESPKKFI